MAILSKIVSSLSLISRINIRNGFIVRNYIAFKPQHCILKNVASSRNKSIFRIFRKPTAAEYKIKDKMSDEIALIYHNTMSRYLLLAQCTSTICMFMIAILVLSNTDIKDYKVNFPSWAEQPKTFNEEILVYIGALITMGTLLQIMVMKMPLRIYTYPKIDKYTFIFYGNLPFTTKRIACSSNEVTKLAETGFLPWNDCRYEIENKQGIILIDNFFRTSADLNAMLGYHKKYED